ncbi:MAG: heme-copper oxidase subunit III [Chloroflexota bacterium]|nr:heme-copper oxidase subunit III [Chloroflexota bacterium]
MQERNKLGMVLFLGSEIGFFGVLILGYVYYYRAYAAGPNAVTALDPLLTGMFTVCLLVSSFTLWRAQKSLERASRSRVNLWLLATVALGSIFVFGQAWEYAQLLRDNVTISSSLFGTTFFTLTGMHGLHVFGGLIALVVLLGLALGGHLNPSRSVAVATVELYWHFVDVVWLVIFAIVYLGPQL